MFRSACGWCCSALVADALTDVNTGHMYIDAVGSLPCNQDPNTQPRTCCSAILLCNVPSGGVLDQRNVPTAVVLALWWVAVEC